MTVAQHRHLLPALVLPLALGLGLWWSWGTWPDVLIDFGRELYTPWRLAERDVLYRDLAYFNGPLSPYLNALWFRLFGPGLLTLVMANTAILAIAVALVDRLVTAVAGWAAALMADLTFIAVFAFGQYLGAGNYNWICPYSHEITHGVTLSLLSIYLAWRNAIGHRWWTAAGSGLALGLVFLTKPEVFLAAAAGVGAFLCVQSWRRHPALLVPARLLMLCVAAALLPPLLAWCLLAFLLPAQDALVGTLGGWAYVFDARLTGNPYFRSLMGTNDPLANLAAMAQTAGAYGVLLAAVTGLSLVFGRARSSVWQGAAVVFLVIALPLWLGRELVPWEVMARPWPAFLLFMLVSAAAASWRRTVEPPAARTLSLQIALLAFSLVLLLKILLNVRVMHYGFGLAMPAAIVLMAAAWTWLPPLVARVGGQPAVFRAGLAAVWLVALLVHLEFSNRHFAAKRHPVGAGRDRFLADGRGAFVSATVDYLERHSGPRETVAVMPEGIMVNYLARRRAPTKFQVYLVPEMLMFGEPVMLAELEQKPPDWLVLIHRDDSEYSHRFFGRDYGQGFSTWIQANYQGVQLFGAHPLTGPYFGVLITQRQKAKLGVPAPAPR